MKKIEKIVNCALIFVGWFIAVMGVLEHEFTSLGIGCLMILQGVNGFKLVELEQHIDFTTYILLHHRHKIGGELDDRIISDTLSDD